MSTGYGYVRMQFTKKDGSADGEIAKKIYRYCTEKFDFFNTDDGRFQAEADAKEDADWSDDWDYFGDAFKLTEEKGEIGSAYVGDGFYIEEAAAEILEDNWIQEIYKEFTPYQMKVQIHQDYSESSFDNNSINRYMVSEENGQRKLSRCRSFYFTNGAQFDTDRYNFESEDGDYYLLNDDCDKYSLMAKNKNTGRVIELNNYVVLNEEDEDLIFYGVYDSDGDSVSLFDDDSMATYEDWDSCIDVDDLLEGESEEQSDWEIYIDVPKRNVFFKEPVKPAAAPAEPPKDPERVLSQINGRTVVSGKRISNIGIENPVCVVKGNTLTFTCDRVVNNSDWDTATIQIRVWFCPVGFFTRESVDTILLSLDLDPLKSHCSYENITKTVQITENINNDNKLKLALTLYEYHVGGDYAGIADGTMVWPVGSVKAEILPPDEPKPAVQKPASKPAKQPTATAKKCASCGSDLPAGASFCIKCGTKVQEHIFCYKCGTKLPADAAFCVTCGTKLK